MISKRTIFSSMFLFAVSAIILISSSTNASAQNANSVRTISGGVLNGKAISKPQPAYPPIARKSRAHGTVTVQILVDEAGRVISATAVAGPQSLREAAVAAARKAKFRPTLLSGQPVKVSGVITYNFVLQ